MKVSMYGFWGEGGGGNSYFVSCRVIGHDEHKGFSPFSLVEVHVEIHFGARATKEF